MSSMKIMPLLLTAVALLVTVSGVEQAQAYYRQQYQSYNQQRYNLGTINGEIIKGCIINSTFSGDIMTSNTTETTIDAGVRRSITSPFGGSSGPNKERAKPAKALAPPRSYVQCASRVPAKPSI
jgi:hypothetical protein